MGIVDRFYKMSVDVIAEDGRVVVCLPTEDLLPAGDVGLELESVHPMKVHKSLTRHVCVLRR